jgi:hypothetical protein
VRCGPVGGDLLGCAYVAVAGVAYTGTADAAQAALGVQQEHARRNDHFALLEAFQDLDPFGQTHTELNRPRLEASLTGSDEHVLRSAGFDDGIPRHRQSVARRRLQ